MYKSESVLGLVGSIVGTVFSFFLLIFTIASAFFLSLFRDFFQGSWHFWVLGQRLDSANIADAASGILIITAAVLLILSVASVILGFVGYGKLKKGEKNGGVQLIVAGALALLSGIGFIPFILFLVGGLMAVTKKETPAIQQQQNG